MPFDPEKLIQQEAEAYEAALCYIVYIDADADSFEIFELNMRRVIDTSKSSMTRVFQYQYFYNVHEALSFLNQNRDRVISVSIDSSPQTINSFAEGSKKLIDKAIRAVIVNDCCVSWIADPRMIAEQGRSLNNQLIRDYDRVFDKAQLSISESDQVKAQADLIKKTLASRSSLLRVELEGENRDSLMSRDIDGIRQQIQTLEALVVSVDNVLSRTNEATGEPSLIQSVKALSRHTNNIEISLDQLYGSSQEANNKYQILLNRFNELKQMMEQNAEAKSDYRRFRLQQMGLGLKVLLALFILGFLAAVMGGLPEAIELIQNIFQLNL